MDKFSAFKASQPATAWETTIVNAIKVSEKKTKVVGNETREWHFITLEDGFTFPLSTKTLATPVVGKLLLGLRDDEEGKPFIGYAELVA